MDSDYFPLQGIVVLLGILVSALYFASIIVLRRYVRMQSLVGMGFVIGGIVFFTTISWPALHDDFPGWLSATGTVARFDKSYGERGRKRTLIAFQTATEGKAEAWLTIQMNDLWNAVPGPPDEDGKKEIGKAILQIQYNPQNPGDVALQGAEPWKYLLGGSIFGGVFVPVGLFLLAGPFMDFVRRRKLAWSGTRSTARIIDIRQDRNYAIRTGKWMPLHYPWMIRAEWVDPKTEASASSNPALSGRIRSRSSPSAARSTCWSTTPASALSTPSIRDPWARNGRRRPPSLRFRSTTTNGRASVPSPIRHRHCLAESCGTGPGACPCQGPAASLRRNCRPCPPSSGRGAMIR